MAARNFWCLTSDAGKQCGHLYFYAPVFSVTEKPPKFSKTHQAIGVLLSNGTGHNSTPRLIICPFLSHAQVPLHRNGNWLATAM